MAYIVVIHFIAYLSNLFNRETRLLPSEWKRRAVTLIIEKCTKVHTMVNILRIAKYLFFLSFFLHKLSRWSRLWPYRFIFRFITFINPFDLISEELFFSKGVFQKNRIVMWWHTCFQSWRTNVVTRSKPEESACFAETTATVETQPMYKNEMQPLNHPNIRIELMYTYDWQNSSV